MGRTLSVGLVSSLTDASRDLRPAAPSNATPPSPRPTPETTMLVARRRGGRVNVVRKSGTEMKV